MDDFVGYIKEISPDKLINNEVSMVDFKCQEILNRIALKVKYPDLSTDNALMFKFPDKIRISLQEFDIYNQALYKKLPDENVEPQQLLEIQSYIPQYNSKRRKTQKYLREMLENQLGYLLIIEIIFKSLSKTELSFEEVCERIWKRLSKSNNNPLYKYAKQMHIEEYKPDRKYHNKLDSYASDDTYSEKEYPDSVDKRISELDFYKEIMSQDSMSLLDTDFTASFKDELTIDCSIINDASINNIVDDFNNLMNNLSDESLNYYDDILDELRDNFVEIIDQIINLFKDFKTSAMNFDITDAEKEINLDKLIKEIDAKENKAFHEQDITIAGRESTHIKTVDKELDKGTKILSDFIDMCANKYSHFILVGETKNDMYNKKDGLPAIEVTLSKLKNLHFVNYFIDKKIKPETFDIVIDQDDICSGYNGHFDMVTRLGQLADTIDKDKTEIVVMVDEGELYLHPDAQKNFILNFLKICPFFFKERDIQLILSTNSPFILSDIPRTNILCLNGLNEEDGLKVDEGDVLGKTFGTNITTLLIKQFFMNDGIVGTFAKQKINTLISKLKSDDYEDNDNQDDKLINIIGDELVNRKLKQMRQEKLKPNTIDKLDQEIRRQEIWLDHLKTERKKLEMELSEDTSE